MTARQTIQCAGLSDRGRVRNKNQDNWSVNEKHGLFIVADGMGGKPGADVVAKIAVDAFPAFLWKKIQFRDEHTDDAAVEKLMVTLREYSAYLHNRSLNHPALAGMGTTFLVVVIRNQHALFSHLGDSRLYLLHDKQLTLLTQDHSIVQYLIDLGEIQPEEAKTHPARSTITQFVGMKDEATPSGGVVQLQSGDCLLLCTDGLTNMVPDQQIRDIITRDQDPKAMCQALVDAANKAGGKDNVTAVIILCQ